MENDLERYKKAYPDSQVELGSLQCIHVLQADLAARIRPAPCISLDMAHARWRAGKPLLKRELLATSQFPLHDALVALRSALGHHAQALVTLDRLLASGYVDAAAGKSFLDDLSHNRDAHTRRVAAALSVNPDLLALLLQVAITPFYESQAAPYRPWLTTFAWRHGGCPICGAEPAMARLAREDGQRILVCCLCRSEWPFDRLRCPFCEAGVQPKGRFFTVDGDSAHRVDCCERCRRYLKTVDERGLAYGVNLRAEEIVTVYLDRLAREQGYH